MPHHDAPAAGRARPRAASTACSCASGSCSGGAVGAPPLGGACAARPSNAAEDDDARAGSVAPRRRVERQPAVAREPGLDPGVRVAVGDVVDAAAPIARARTPRRRGPGTPERRDERGQRGGEHLAVARAPGGRPARERVRAIGQRRVLVVGARGAQPGLERDDGLVRRGRSARDGARLRVGDLPGAPAGIARVRPEERGHRCSRPSRAERRDRLAGEAQVVLDDRRGVAGAAAPPSAACGRIGVGAIGGVARARARAGRSGTRCRPRRGRPARRSAAPSSRTGWPGATRNRSRQRLDPHRGPQASARRAHPRPADRR